MGIWPGSGAAMSRARTAPSAPRTGVSRIAGVIGRFAEFLARAGRTSQRCATDLDPRRAAPQSAEQAQHALPGLVGLGEHRRAGLGEDLVLGERDRLLR